MKYVLILGLIAVLVAGFAYYTLFAVSGDKYIEEIPPPAVPLAAESSDTDQPFAQAGDGTLDQILAWSMNVECSILREEEAGETKIEGTFFVADGLVRGDFLVPSPDLSGVIPSSIIITDDTLYTWSLIDGESYGMKFANASGADESVDSVKPVAFDSSITYDCKEWREVDYTVFTPPSKVLFTDYADLIKAGMEDAVLYE